MISTTPINMDAMDANFLISYRPWVANYTLSGGVHVSAQ
jgi:hypothetical protein